MSRTCNNYGFTFPLHVFRIRLSSLIGESSQSTHWLKPSSHSLQTVTKKKSLSFPITIHCCQTVAHIPIICIQLKIKPCYCNKQETLISVMNKQKRKSFDNLSALRTKETCQQIYLCRFKSKCCVQRCLPSGLSLKWQSSSVALPPPVG